MEHYVIKPAGEAGEAAVHAGLRAYNRTFVSDTADLSLVVEDGAGQIIGGCNAFRMGELALLDVLWVVESRRGTGLGACLLAQLEQDAARQGAKRLELNRAHPAYDVEMEEGSRNQNQKSTSVP